MANASNQQKEQLHEMIDSISDEHRLKYIFMIIHKKFIEEALEKINK